MEGGRATNQIILGLFFLILGAVVLLPGTRDFFRMYREWQFRMMPWLRRIPGVELLYGDRAQRLLLRTVGSIFVLVGVLTMVGLIHVK